MYSLTHSAGHIRFGWCPLAVNTVGATTWAEKNVATRLPEFTSGINWVRIAQYLVFCVLFADYCPLFAFSSFLSGLRFRAFGYPFGILKLFFLICKNKIEKNHGHHWHLCFLDNSFNQNFHLKLHVQKICLLIQIMSVMS